ncbi:Tcc44h21-2.6 [Trypanosoma grayi]|uniref:Tcc44h21-2.6 n=1 Tax=Trypanosoma grayi TaxID=71804 RepID=UPI0004F3F2A3|nr:Tcc44h21-2.6 [Trypanosoma grayi]KEG15179.1 Tcc44h21-2.6 [Trypanosoma grayi]
MFQAQTSARAGGAFYCASCNLYCSDSRSAEMHRASLKHKKKSGELEIERRLYGDDASVTVKDVMALVERKRVELGVVPWSELRFQEAEARSGESS